MPAETGRDAIHMLQTTPDIDVVLMKPMTAGAGVCSCRHLLELQRIALRRQLRTSATLHGAMQNAIAQGVMFITIAHNDGSVLRYPGNLPTCITVGATDSHDGGADSAISVRNSIWSRRGLISLP